MRLRLTYVCIWYNTLVSVLMFEIHDEGVSHTAFLASLEAKRRRRFSGFFARTALKYVCAPVFFFIPA